MKKVSTQKEFAKKLAGYSGMAGAFILAHTSASGQVMYTDVNPDETYSENGEFYELDLNGDGSVDFAFKINDFSAPGVFNSAGGATWGGLIQDVLVYSYNGAVGGSSFTSGTLLPYALNAGVTIDGDMQFNTNSLYGNQIMAFYLGIQSYYASGTTLAWFTSPVGNWSGKTEKFVALRLDDGGASYYGWARLSVDDNNHEFTIHDYAVKMSEEAAIETGETVGIHTVIQNNQLNAYSFGSTINVVIKDLQTTGATVKVFNLEGKVVYQNELNMNGMQINLDNVAAGAYTLQVVTNESGVYTKTVSIQK